MSIIKIEKLVKRYGELVAVDHLSLDIKEGEIFGLLGPNGSGKSTTINCILSLLEFDKGSIEVFGKEMKPESYDIKKEIGIIMQNVAVFDDLTVYENIDYFCGLYISDKAIRQELVKEAIEFTGLEEFTKFYPKKLSGGLLRRLNIACGIAHKPKLIILDEPTVAVDPQSRNKILEGIKKLNEEGATVIYTSHYMEEVEILCSRIAIMDKGRIVAQGTKEELKEMIDLGETITLDVSPLSDEILTEIGRLPHVMDVNHTDNLLTIKFSKGSHNLLRLLDLLKDKQVPFGNIHSEQPTLNDVFLTITGRELRD
ncbi:MAG: ABC transporter ATP-binding protein [Lachnospiraceae bacterium]|nr:ABC transporter ATP-binding protein [Lachnospiraceae bacterium]